MSQTRGFVEATACPWCRKVNDFRPVEDYGLEKGAVFSCDHCKRNFKVANVQTKKIIWLARTNERGNLHGG